jgi:hypothetical protein
MMYDNVMPRQSPLPGYTRVDVGFMLSCDLFPFPYTVILWRDQARFDVQSLRKFRRESLYSE